MKQKTITTDKATLLVVEMREGITEIGNTDKRISIPDRKGGHHFVYGNWQLLGRLPEITEEQADKVVDEYTYNTGEIDGYYDYENDTQTDCPIESLNSLMYTNEVYFENKYGDERPPNLPVDADPYTSKKGYIKFREERKHLPPSDLMVSYEAYCMSWQESQSKVWDKERTFLFIKVD